jgi:hypothetical protein
MNLQVRKISGNTFTSADKLEVVFSSDNQPMDVVLHTIEHVSGPSVTHGGGGSAGEYLHYKAVERDADADGIIDYSTTEMRVVQEEQGASVIKVACSVITKAQADILKIANIEWSARMMAASDADEEFSEAPPSQDPIILTTGEVTLMWAEDSLV